MATITNTIRWASNSAELAANLKQGMNVIDATRASAEKMVQTLSGDRLIAAANKYTAAVMQMGGAAGVMAGAEKLSAGEKERINTLLTKAIEKYTLLGQTAPQAMRDLAEATKSVTPPTEQAGISFGKLVASWVTAQAVIGAVKTVFADLTGFVMGSVKAAGEEEVAMAKLRAALIQQGTAVPSVITAYENLAKQYERTSVFSDDLLKSTMGTLAVVGGVMPRDMDNALKAVTNLASAFGGEQGLEKATLAVSKAAEGNITGLKRLGVSVDEAKYKSEGFSAVLTAINDKFGGQAQALAETYTGRIAQLGNAWNDLEQDVGKVIIQNQTVLALFGAITGEINNNTKNLADNAQAMTLVSDAVIGLVRGFGLLASSIDLVQTTYYALRIVSNETFAAIAKFWTVLLDVEAAALRISGSLTPGPYNLYGQAAKQAADSSTYLKGAIEGLHADSEAAKNASIAHGNALTGVATKASQLADQLESTRGQVAKLKEGTDQGTDAWTKHTVAVGKDSKATDEMAKALANLRLETAGYAGVLNSLSGEVIEAISWELKHGGQIEDVAKGYGVAKASVEAIQAQLKFEASVVEASSKAWADHTVMLVDTGDQYDEADRRVHLLGSSLTMMYMNWLPNVGKSADSASLKVKNLGESFSDELIGTLNEMPILIQKAFTGGGGLTGAVKAIGADLGSTLGKSIVGAIPGSIGKIGDEILPGIGGAIGSFLGSLISKIINIGGPSKAELAGRQLQATFEKSFGTFNDMAKAIGAAYAATGRSAAQANTDILALMAAEKQGAEETQAAIDKINQAFDEQKQDAADLTAAISKYGFSIQELGPEMKKQELDKQAQTLLNDWRLLVGSGIDLATVNTHMASSMGDYLKLARETGQEVPIAMQPILQKMIDQGLLLDDNGDKITDLKSLGVSFSETMTAGLQHIVDRLDVLLQGLGLIGPTLAGIPTSKDITITTHNKFVDDAIIAPVDQSAFDQHTHAAAMGGIVHSGWLQHFDMGGMVSNSRWRMPKGPGTDTQLVWTTPGELIMNASQQGRLADLLHTGAVMASDLAKSGPVEAAGDGDLYVTVEMDGMVAANAMVKHFATDRQGIGTKARRVLNG